ncbi:CDP-alcohol phosphatidyltransferase family protein [Streptomyces sp. NPDC058434]|uniref:CDP-alcohol phosphatidyltransferase family protein n=1 Tax=Streptomyces sp. NPDC058434 TaxID=3346498 RepID=UPI0036607AC0
MKPVSAMADSRAATNALLAELREDRLAPEAVGRFVGQAAHRSLGQAARRPRALAELTALHAILYTLAAGRRPGPGWVAASWVPAASHLGLLEHRTRLAPADILTLLRANLPALPGGTSRASGVLAVGLDLADGRLARHQGTTSPFGDYADTFADAAFWMWLHHLEPRCPRFTGLLALHVHPYAALHIGEYADTTTTPTCCPARRLAVSAASARSRSLSLAASPTSRVEGTVRPCRS